MDKQRNVLLGVVGVVFAMTFFPVAGYAATEATPTSTTTTSATRTAAKSTSIKGAAAVGAQVVTAVQKKLAGSKTATAKTKAAKTSAAPAVEKKLASREAPSAMLVDEIPTVKTMEKTGGEITSLGRSAIGIVYERTEQSEYEMMIPLDPKVKFTNFKKFSELGLRDEVKFDYEKTIQYPKEPNEKILMAVKSITLVKKYKPEEGSQGQ